MGGYFQVYCPECGSGWTVTETSKEFNVVSDGYENGFDQKATVQVNDKLITE